MGSVKIPSAEGAEPKGSGLIQRTAVGVMKTAEGEHTLSFIRSSTEESKALGKQTGASIQQVLEKAGLSTAMQEVATQGKGESGAKIELKADLHAAPSQESIRSQITLDPGLAHLTEKQKEALIRRCLKGYERALNSFERVVADIGWDSPEAQAFADEFIQRLAAIADAYFEVQVEQGKAPDTELARLMNRTQFFSRPAAPYDSGSVGYNPLAITKVIHEGNLRERLTMANTAIFGPLLHTIYNNPDLISQINRRLALLPEDKTFQIDPSDVAKIVGRNEKNEDVYITSPVVRQYREKEAGRVQKLPTTTRPEAGPQGPRVGTLKEPSPRELLAGLGEVVSKEEVEKMEPSLATKKVTWRRGGDLFAVNPKTTFAQQAVARGKTPVITGPSGTSDVFFKIAQTLKLDQKMDQMINKEMLALATWLIPTRDHSLHEVRVLLPEYGIPYSGMPEDFAHIYDEAFTQKVQDKMPEHRLPPFYLGKEYQMRVACQLGFLKETKRPTNLQS